MDRRDFLKAILAIPVIALVPIAVTKAKTLVVSKKRIKPMLLFIKHSSYGRCINVS